MQKKMFFIVAFIITIFITSTFLAIGSFLDKTRSTRINELGIEAYKNINDMQTFMLLSEVYGNEMGCLAFKGKLQEIDKSVWDLGLKIDQYRIATEEFQKDPFYLEQKKIFNENELFYLLLLSKINKNCNSDKEIVLFFYKKAEECDKCDDQSFVLTDLKKDAENEISIFSFDMDLNITTLHLLETYYKIDTYPCIVIQDKKHCGIQDKKSISQLICSRKNESYCKT